MDRCLSIKWQPLEILRSRNVISEHASLVQLYFYQCRLSVIGVHVWNVSHSFGVGVGTGRREVETHYTTFFWIIMDQDYLTLKSLIRKCKKPPCHWSSRRVVFCLHNSFLSVSVQFSIRLTKAFLKLDCLTFCLKNRIFLPKPFFYA